MHPQRLTLQLKFTHLLNATRAGGGEEPKGRLSSRDLYGEWNSKIGLCFSLAKGNSLYDQESTATLISDGKSLFFFRHPLSPAR